jgi:cell division protein FtsB
VEPTLERRYKRQIAQLETENAALKKEVAELKAAVP